MGDRKGTPLPYGKNAVRLLTLVEFIPIQSENQQNIGFEFENALPYFFKLLLFVKKGFTNSQSY